MNYLSLPLHPTTGDSYIVYNIMCCKLIYTSYYLYYSRSLRSFKSRHRTAFIHSLNLYSAHPWGAPSSTAVKEKIFRCL